MALICLNPLTTRDGAVLAVNGFTGRLQPGKITGFRRPNGAGKTTTLRMPVESIRATPGTPIIDRHTRLQPARPFPAIGAMTDSAVSDPPRSGRDTPRGRDNSSPAISQRVTRPGLAATAVLIFVVHRVWIWRHKRASNPQGGANGRQPFGPETDSTSAAAASRRSP